MKVLQQPTGSVLALTSGRNQDFLGSIMVSDQPFAVMIPFPDPSAKSIVFTCGALSGNPTLVSRPWRPVSGVSSWCLLLVSKPVSRQHSRPVCFKLRLMRALPSVTLGCLLFFRVEHRLSGKLECVRSGQLPHSNSLCGNGHPYLTYNTILWDQ
ncbi:hypothetical protein BJV82DRAFT_370679 [Fennellomyces sp. T-0311]|nr:hypothetical protein BJV82DRAFT_370679 [Fennellomyces sp. T-0311]